MLPATADDPPKPEARSWRQRGQQALRAGQPAEARRALRTAVAAHPDDAAAWLELARLSSPHARLAYTAKAIELSRGAPVDGSTQPPVFQHPPDARSVSRLQARARAELRRARRSGAGGPPTGLPMLAPALAGDAAAIAVARPARSAAGRRFVRRGAGMLVTLLLFVAACVAVAAVGPGIRVVQNLGTYWSPPAVARALAQLSRPTASATPLPPTGTAQPASTPSSAPATGMASGELPAATATEAPTATAPPSASPTSTQTATPEPSATPTPTLEPASPTPAAAAQRWVDVDLTHQTATAFEDQSPVRNFIVSTGTWDHPTVTGQYHIYVKYVAADMAGPGYYLPAVPYVMYFYEGYGLHGTYWHHNFGHPMSHGCVNLKTEDAAWLFDWAAVGTLVNVHY